MLFGGEVLTRQAQNADWTVIVKEISYKGRKPYCRVHSNFQDGNNIYEPFEDVCKKYGATVIQPVCPTCGKVWFKATYENMVCKVCGTHIRNATDEVRTEITTAYAGAEDMTFVLLETYDGKDLVSTEVTGFYYGSPDTKATEAFKNKLKATY